MHGREHSIKREDPHQILSAGLILAFPEHSICAERKTPSDEPSLSPQPPSANKTYFSFAIHPHYGMVYLAVPIVLASFVLVPAIAAPIIESPNEFEARELDR